MINFDDIFALAKKTANALSKGNKPLDLEQSDLFRDRAKRRILKELSEEACEFQIEQLKSIDTSKDWKKVVLKINSNKKESIRHMYKVAAVILILISVGYLTLFTNTDNIDLDNKIIEISAGSDKAILTLEDGSEVVLEKGSTFKNATVHSNGERLEYASTDEGSKIAFNVLTIPRGGQYQILLSDGTMVWLNADTQIKYPVNFVDGKPRNLELVYGEAYFKVSPSNKHKGSTFKVVSKFQEVEVLGTAFNIKAYNDEKHIYTTLVEGRVQIVADEKEQKLIPSDQLIFNKDTKQITKHQVNVEYDIAWVRGYFNFKDKPLKDIMTVLSRWYDVEIDFEAQELENIKFSGLLNRKQDIEDILNGFKNTKFINAYEIKNSTITIK